MEQTIVLSSEKARKVDNKNTPSNFTTYFDSPIVLNKNKSYVIGLDQINTMTYSWYNISDEHNNNKIQYHNGTEMKEIEFTNGNYSYDDISNYIRETLILNGDFDDISSTPPISIEFDLSSFKVLITIMDGFRLDLSLGNFHTLIGFNKEVVDETKYGSKLPNITNSVDALYIHCDLVNNSIVDGSYGDVIYVVSTANLTRSYPFEKEPIRIKYCEVNKTVINSIRINISSFSGKIINLNGVDTSFTFMLKEF